ncbi:MAG: ABC transporter ATP-binding protein [Myxococcales bacterium]|nr:ABC transporter ATP-binding protein [Myxococcales bacterium]
MLAQGVVEIHGLIREFRGGDGELLQALAGVDLRVDVGEMVAIMGTSGSGKSTLLNILGCLDRPTSGTYRLAGVDVAGLQDDALADIRNERIGFIFQGFNLLHRTSALENVMLPMLYDRRDRFPDPAKSARAVLERVGLGARLHHEPSQLSGGQQQRVAIARALVTQPDLLLADEPTGNLDSHTTLDVMALFQELHREGMTQLIVTHEDEVASYCTRAIVLRDGRIVSDRPVPPRRAASDLARLWSAGPSEAAS